MIESSMSAHVAGLPARLMCADRRYVSGSAFDEPPIGSHPTPSSASTADAAEVRRVCGPAPESTSTDSPRSRVSDPNGIDVPELVDHEQPVVVHDLPSIVVGMNARVTDEGRSEPAAFDADSRDVVVDD